MPLHASDEPQNTGNSATAATAATVSVEHGLKNLELQRPPSMSMSLPPRDGGGAPFAQSTYGTASSTLHVNHWSTSTSSTSPSLPTPSDDGGDYLSDSRRSRQAPPASGASSASQVAPATASSALLLSVLRDKIQQREAMRRMLAQLDDEITQTMSLAVGDASDVTQSGGGGGHLSSAAHENVALAQHGNDSGDTDMAMNLSRPVLTQRRSSAAVFNGQAVVTTAGLPTVMPSQATTTAMVASPMASGAPSETLGSCLPNAKNNPCHRFDKADCQTMREMVHTAAATGTSTATLAAIACPISVNGSSAAEAGYPSQPVSDHDAAAMDHLLKAVEGETIDEPSINAEIVSNAQFERIVGLFLDSHFVPINSYDYDGEAAMQGDRGGRASSSVAAAVTNDPSIVYTMPLDVSATAAGMQQPGIALAHNGASMLPLVANSTTYGSMVGGNNIHAPSSHPPHAFTATASKKAGKKRGPYAKRNATEQYVCARCGTTNSPVWRCKKSGTIMCNACGLWMKKHHLCSDNGKIVGWDPVNGRVGPNALGEEPTVHGSDKDEP